MKKKQPIKPEQSEGLELKKKYKQVWSKISNKSEIPQMFYDCYQDSHILEPGESKKIVTELKEIYVPISESEK